MKRGLLFAGLAAIAAAAVFLSLHPSRGPVATVTVDRGAVEEIVRAAGRTHVRKRYTITAPLDGYLPSFPWHAGDRVRSGDVLLQMSPAQDAAFDLPAHEAALAEAARAQATLETAQAAAEAARTHAEFAETGYVRLEQAFASGEVTWKDLDHAEQVLKDARAHLRAAEFSVDVARHELNAANVRVDHTREDGPAGGPVPVRTPIGGVVLSIAGNENADVTQRLAAGTPLLEIGDPATLEIHADVSTADAVRLEPGGDVRIVHAADGQLQGRVHRIEPAAFTQAATGGADEQRVRVAIGITSPREQWAKLGDGYPVNVEFVVWRRADVIRVPASVLYQQEDRWMALRVRGERAYGTPVVIGHRGERYAEVLDGLAPGDVLALDPKYVQDGAHVSSAR